MPAIILDNFRPIVAIAVTLVSLGMGWEELTHRIDQKAEVAALNELRQRMEAAESRGVREAGINRILLCRLPEIRPDSYCEGLR